MEACSVLLVTQKFQCLDRGWSGLQGRCRSGRLTQIDARLRRYTICQGRLDLYCSVLQTKQYNDRRRDSYDGSDLRSRCV